MISRLSLFVFFVVLGTAVARKRASTKKAQLTNYCSYPPCCENNSLNPPYTEAERRSCPGKEECDQFNGCDYQGDLKFCGENNSHDYVIRTNIVAFFSTHDDINKYERKTLRITQGENTIDAIVCDTCADWDCHGCCSANVGNSGYLIDMEANTYMLDLAAMMAK